MQTSMKTINVKFLTFSDAPSKILDEGIKRLSKLCDKDIFKYTNEDVNPDLLFFLTGGSERAAIECVKEDKFYVLIGSKHDNAYASATEVKAYLNERCIGSILLDEEDPNTARFLSNFLIVKRALSNLKGKKIGQIGSVSDWLVSSTISAVTLKDKLGITLLEIPWEEIPHYSKFAPADDFINFFKPNSNLDLIQTAQVDSMLRDIIKMHQLNSITVECFPMVQKDGVTACLPLAKLNNEGFPAGCEGDITAITGMMLGKELTGVVPWIVNVNKVSEDISIFSHCTVAPILLSDYKVTTHFETGKGTAIAGDLKSELVTIFRINNKLNKAFISVATVVGRPKSPTACRTQIEVKLPKESVKLLKEEPLGNHHLVLPGNWSELLKQMFTILGVEVL